MDALLEEALADFDEVAAPAPARPVAQQGSGGGPTLPPRPARPGAASPSAPATTATASEVMRPEAGGSAHPEPSISEPDSASSPAPKGLGGLSLGRPKAGKGAKGNAHTSAGPPMPPEARKLADDLMSLFQEALGGPEGDDEAGADGDLMSHMRRAFEAAGGAGGAPGTRGPAAGSDPMGLGLGKGFGLGGGGLPGRSGASAARQGGSLAQGSAAAASGGDAGDEGFGEDAPAGGGSTEAALEQLLAALMGGGGGGGPPGAGLEGLLGMGGGMMGGGMMGAAAPSGMGMGGDDADDDDAFSHPSLAGLAARTREAVSKTAKATRGQLPEGHPGMASSSGGGPAGMGGLFGGLLGGLGGAAGMGGEGGPGMNMMLDYIMRNLLSKDVLYGPLKDIRQKYPPWLEAHRGRLPEGDFVRYEAQYASIQAVCAQYEQAPEDFDRLVELIQEMQAHGDPPNEIVEDITGMPGGVFGNAAGGGGPLGRGAGGEGGMGLGGEGEEDIPPALQELSKDLEQQCKMQ